MPPLPPPPPPPPPMSSAGGASGMGKKDVEIVTIPEKFYGVALKMKSTLGEEAPPPTVPKLPPPPPKIKPAPRGRMLPIILVLLVIILGVGGGFVYFNQGLLFKKPAPATPPPAPVATAPIAPANLAAVVSGSAISLTWVDAATDETGYRVERREGLGTFLPLTNLAQNSTTFLDSSAQASKTYSYRVIAVNDGGESSPSNEASATLPAPPAVTPPPPTLPPGGLDSDSDGLTDLEETLVYNTDAHAPDTDRDGFLDGNEVFHLYNPGARAPVRLLDSGLVTNLQAPAGWSIYLPKVWTGSLDVADGSRATIDTQHGETFKISLEDNAAKAPLMDWYLARNPGVTSDAVRSITTKGGLEGILGADRLDAYFAWGDKIFVIRYDIDGQTFINFRTTFEMMLNSLKLVGAPVVAVAPAENLQGPGTLVEVPSATSTSAATSTPEAAQATGTQP